MTKNLIPTINISSIVKNNFENKKSVNTINSIKNACIDIGFFQVTGHGISQKKLKIFVILVTNFLIHLKKIK